MRFTSPKRYSSSIRSPSTATLRPWIGGARARPGPGPASWLRPSWLPSLGIPEASPGSRPRWDRAARTSGTAGPPACSTRSPWQAGQQRISSSRGSSGMGISLSELAPGGDRPPEHHTEAWDHRKNTNVSMRNSGDAGWRRAAHVAEEASAFQAGVLGDGLDHEVGPVADISVGAHEHRSQDTAISIASAIGARTLGEVGRPGARSLLWQALRASEGVVGRGVVQDGTQEPSSSRRSARVRDPHVQEGPWAFSKQVQAGQHSAEDTHKEPRHLRQAVEVKQVMRRRGELPTPAFMAFFLRATAIDGLKRKDLGPDQASGLARCVVLPGIVRAGTGVAACTQHHCAEYPRRSPTFILPWILRGVPPVLRSCQAQGILGSHFRPVEADFVPGYGRWSSRRADISGPARAAGGESRRRARLEKTRGKAGGLPGA